MENETTYTPPPSEVCVKANKIRYIYDRSKPPPDASKVRYRTCLGPNCLGMKTFLSTHSGNRICNLCKRIYAEGGSSI